MLGGVELARFFAGPRGELADQVFIGIAQGVDVRGEFRQPFGDLLDDGAELGIPVYVGLAELGGTEIDLGEQALEGALKGFRLDVFEARLQGVEQLCVLDAGQVGNAVPQVRGLDDVMHLAPHLLFESRDVVYVVRVPQR